MTVTSLYDDDTKSFRIDRADPTILVSVEVVDEADSELLSFADGILTFRASNATMRYRVLGSTGASYRVLGEDEWHHAPVVCEQIAD